MVLDRSAAAAPKEENEMPTVSLLEAQARLPELLEKLQPGEEVTIEVDGRPFAQLKRVERTSWSCKAGCYAKPEFWMAPDFDAPLEDFKEYME
jgi:antitoxin (DNA-binding transcriptional repressor) of toxin-antitoxin stability system